MKPTPQKIIIKSPFFFFGCFISPFYFFDQYSNSTFSLELNRQDTHFHWYSPPCNYLYHVGSYQDISGQYGGLIIRDYHCIVEE